MAVLIVDDDENILIALKLLLKSEGMNCIACHSPKEALAAFRQETCQLALVDLNYFEDTTSGKEGLDLIAALREIDDDFPIIAMTGWGTIGIAVEAIRRGAADFIEKPWDDNDRLLASIRTQIKLHAAQKRERKLSAENALLREQNSSALFIYQSPEMNQLLSVADRIAASSIPVLITGENGTGKSLLANYIHQKSSYAQGPFIGVNMGAIAESTFESELFGHTKGAFTDAKTDRIGRIELADQGTLFMDEIANLPLAQQLGSSHTKLANIRFISATNADLDGLIAEKGFRQDLLYRLNGITLRMPALRERKSDILPLAESFLQKALSRYNSPAQRLSNSARHALERYSWPGNIRELQHVIERSVLLAAGKNIEEQELQLTQQLPSSGTSNIELTQLTLEQAEIWFIEQALNRCHGNANDAAKELGISRSALYRRLGKREPS
jgi:DNA-binding NtrC family response regulator